MILYDNRSYVHIVLRLSGSLILSKNVIVPVLFSSTLCVLFFQFPEPMRLHRHLEWPAWVYSTALTFALVFRTALAYRRYWQGVGATMSMVAAWRCAFVNYLAFIGASIQEYKRRGNVSIVAELERSRTLVTHWFSLLFATSVQTLQWQEKTPPLHMLQALPDEFKQDLTPGSFWAPFEEEQWKQIYTAHAATDAERAQMANCFDILALIMQWIEVEVTRLFMFQRMLIQSPILTRIFEDLSAAALAYCDAHMISHIPFPFPFAQVLTFALYAFIVMCPFIVQASAAERLGGLKVEPIGLSWAALVFMNGCLVAGAACLNEIAIELEEPFEEKMNNFPVRKLQRRIDCSLQNLANLREPPQDFGCKGFCEQSEAWAADHLKAGVAKALTPEKSVLDSGDTSAGASVIRICEDLGADSRRMSEDMERLELEACDIAYHMLMPGNDLSTVQTSKVSKSATASPPLLPSEERPPAEPEPEAEADPESRMNRIDEGRLRELVEASAEVNSRMAQLLIKSFCFDREEEGGSAARADAVG